MPQLDFNIFAGIAGGLTIIFYLSYIGVLLVPIARFGVWENAHIRYRRYKVLQLFLQVEAAKKLIEK